MAFFFGVFTSQSEAGGRTEGRRLSPKTSPKGEFEGLEAASTKCEWLGVRITVRIWIFGVSRVIMLIFLIFRAEADTCWSARFARSRVGGVARLFKEISVFFSDFGTFSIFSYFSDFGGFGKRTGGFVTRKKRCLGHLSDFVIFSHLWHFIMNGRLFIT